MSIGSAGWAASLLAAIVAVLPSALPAQQEISWSDFRPCPECRIVARRLVSLGTESGPGEIESDAVWIASAPGRGYTVHGINNFTGTRFSLFDEQGRFLRRFGREGDGPGEVRALAGVRFGKPGELIVLDGLRRVWITFREDGALLSEVRGDRLEPGRFDLVGDGSTAVVATMGRRAESAGFPLHLIDLSTGNPVRHFGADDNPIWSLDEPSGGTLHLGQRAGNGNTLWWGKVGRPHLEEWTLQGEPARRITGTLDFFPVTTVRESMAPNVPPTVRVRAFAVDDADRLWLLTVVPDARWRQVERRGPEGSILPEDIEIYLDTRLDVFDLNNRRHLGSLHWDTPSASLLARGNQVLLQMVEYQTALWPRAVVYELEVLEAERGRR